MAKETRQQIIENTRKKIASKYAEQVRSLKEQLHQANIAKNNAWKTIGQLERENDELKLKIKEHEDWIERLMEFVNMSADEREREIALIRQKQANAEAEARLFNSPLFQLYGRMFGM